MVKRRAKGPQPAFPSFLAKVGRFLSSILEGSQGNCKVARSSSFSRPYAAKDRPKAGLQTMADDFAVLPRLAPYVAQRACMVW
jgi:hypothetical protein